jgi:hypothetical protein
MLLRMALLFALTDLTLTTIEVRHIHAALAWTRFHRDSVKFIFNYAAGEDTRGNQPMQQEKFSNTYRLEQTV